MSEREFGIGAILSITDGHLMCDMGGIYEILNFMTGESLMTHQLSRAARECEAPLRAQLPDIAAIVIPDDLHGSEAYLALLASIVAEHGPTRIVQPLAVQDHTSIDPITELRMMQPGTPLIIIDHSVILDNGQ